DPVKSRGDWWAPARSTGGERDAAQVRITLVGANVAAPALGLERLPTEVNYFLGNDPGQWRTGVAACGKVRYQSVYPGIDVVYYRSLPLIIDPVLVYSTFLGGNGFDRAWDIAVDATGNAYLVGETSSTNLPNAGPPYPTYNGGLCDVFVAKLAASGTNLVFAT